MEKRLTMIKTYKFFMTIACCINILLSFVQYMLLKITGRIFYFILSSCKYFSNEKLVFLRQVWKNFHSKNFFLFGRLLFSDKYKKFLHSSLFSTLLLEKFWANLRKIFFKKNFWICTRCFLNAYKKFFK